MSDLLDEFTPMAGNDGELDLMCPICLNWIDVLPRDGNWLSLGQLRDKAREHLEQRHREVIEGEAVG